MEGFFRILLESNGIAGVLVFPDEKDVLVHRILADAKIPAVVLGIRWTAPIKRPGT